MNANSNLIYCPRCGFKFYHVDSKSGKSIGGASGIITGAITGSKIGIAMGPSGLLLELYLVLF